MAFAFTVLWNTTLPPLMLLFVSHWLSATVAEIAPSKFGSKQMIILRKRCANVGLPGGFIAFCILSIVLTRCG